MKNEFILRQPELLSYLVLLILFVLFRVYQVRKRNKDVHEFLPSKTAEKALSVRQLLKLVFATIGLALMIFSLSRPASNPHPEYLFKKGRDLTFVLDVSNSMLAEDLLPNRLERAKLYIQDCVASLENHRVALVVFAGSATIKCPLTNDVDFFLESLETAGPDSVAHGGTRISDAILKTADKIFSKDSESQNIILLSDGGNQAKQLKTAIEVLNKKKIRLFCIGLGDEVQGARIPDVNKPGEFLKEPIKGQPSEVLDFDGNSIAPQGPEIWSKLETAKMKELVNSVKGAVYIPAGTKDLKLDEVYRDLQRMSPARQKSEHKNIVYDDQFHVFLGIGLAFLVISLLISEGQGKKAAKTVLSLSMIFLLCSFGENDILKERAKLQEKPSLEGYKALAQKCFENKRFDLAVEFYQRALKETKLKEERLSLTYNLAVSFHNDARFGQAKEFAELAEASESLPDDFVIPERPSMERLALVNRAVALYRLVIAEERDDLSIQNLTAALVYRKDLIEKIKKEQKLQKELQGTIQALRELLQKSLELQVSVLEGLQKQIKKVEEKDLKSIDEGQKKTELSTQESLKAAEAGKVKFKDHQEAFGLLDMAYSHIFTSLEAQGRIYSKSALLEKDALAKTSRMEIERALAALAMNDQQQDSSSDSDDSESSEDDEGETEESDEESDSEDADESESSEMQEGMNPDEIPPPKDSAEDLIKREKQLQKSRAENQKKSGSRRSKEGVTW